MVTIEDATLEARAWGERLGVGSYTVQDHTPGRLWVIRAGDGRAYVLKNAREVVPAEALDLLISMGVPVAPPLPTDTGDRSKPEGDWHWTLYDHLPGAMMRDHLAPGARDRAVQFGEAVGTLHVALASMSGAGRSVLDLAGVVRDAATRPPIDVAPELARVWEESKATLPAMLDGLPTHIIHRDPNPGNMLFENGKLSGWVDFDLAVVGPRIFNSLLLCFGHSFGVSNELRDSGAMDTHRRRSLAAYDRVAHLTARERTALGATLMAIQILFVGFSHSQGRDDLAHREMVTLHWIHRTWPEATQGTALATA